MIGIDGCKGGWIAVAGDDGRALAYRTCASLQQLLDESPDDVVGIDMPIGLLDAGRRGGRTADAEARRLLPGFAASIFSAPVRPALDHPHDYRAAHAASVASSSDGVGLSRQSHALTRKIAEVDTLMTPALQSRVREVHPELSFAEMNGGPLSHRKRSGAGFFERLRLLEACGVFVPERSAADEGLRFAVDDLLDAMAAWWTARRIAEGVAEAVPAEAEYDSRGLAMQVWR